MNLLHLLARFQVVFIIDAVDFKAQPGETRVFTLDEIKSQKLPVRLSTHEADFLKILNLSKELNELPHELFIFAIQPKDVSHGTNLSKEVKSVLDTIYKKLVQEIQSRTPL
jgi:hydrogenase maturation protease